LSSELNRFVFSGLLGTYTVRDLEARGVLRERAVSATERRDQDLFVPVEEEIRSGSIAMQRAYRVLYVFENIVRALIASTLEEEYGSAWFDLRANADMKRRLEQRLANEEKHQWHPGRNRHPIFYLDFGDLAKLIGNNWASFADLLPSQIWVQSRLDEAERSRNVIAHTNLLASEEAARLEMYLRDWIKQIG
jgi:hypothetical protein